MSALSTSQQGGIGARLSCVGVHSRQLVSGGRGMGRSHGLPRELAAAVSGAWGGEGADTGGGDQPTGQGRVEVHLSIGQGRNVDLETLDLKLQELKLVKPVLWGVNRERVCTMWNL